MPMAHAGQHQPHPPLLRKTSLSSKAMGAQVPTHCCAVNTCQGSGMSQEHSSTQAFAPPWIWVSLMGKSYSENFGNTFVKAKRT